MDKLRPFSCYAWEAHLLSLQRHGQLIGEPLGREWKLSSVQGMQLRQFGEIRIDDMQTKSCM